MIFCNILRLGEDMHCKTLLIVDDNTDWCNLLKKEAVKCGFFTVAEPLHDGLSAVEYIVTNKPDVIILDMLLPEYDGLYIIRYLRKNTENYNPFIYVVSTIDFIHTSRIMTKMDIGYYSIKPMRAEAVISNLCDLVINAEAYPVKSSLGLGLNAYSSGYPEAVNINKIIDNHLLKLGARLNRISTRCLRDALRHCLQDESKLSNFAAVFRMVASEMSPPMTYRAVDRDIRMATKYIIKESTPYFEECFPDKRKNITSSQLIITSVDKLRVIIGEAHVD